MSEQRKKYPLGRTVYGNQDMTTDAFGRPVLRASDGRDLEKLRRPEVLKELRALGVPDLPADAGKTVLLDIARRHLHARGAAAIGSAK